jgi:hypothetical protein
VTTEPAAAASPPDAIATARAAVTAATPGSAAYAEADAALEAAYKAKYPEPTEQMSTREDISPPAPVRILSDVSALRAELQKHNPGSPQHAALDAQLTAAYQAAYPEPVSTEPEPTLAERYPVEGVTWDEAGITETMKQAPSDEARTAFHGVLGAVTGAMMGGRQYTVEQGEAKLLEELAYDQPKLDALVADGRVALAEAARLGRQAWVDDLEARGLLNDPHVVKALAALGAKLTARP